MDNQNSQERLVRMLTERVLAAIAARGKRASTGDGLTAAAPIHPPAGTCTGDYSKFEELRSRMAGASSNPSSSSAQPVLSGIITLKALEGLTGKTLFLAHGARLTPLAADHVREKGLTLQRMAAGESGRGGETASGPVTPAWLWWLDGPCRASAAIAEGGRMKEISQSRQSQNLHSAILEMARDVKDGRAPGGILFVKSAAQAACFANRCRSLRAVVGTCPEAVAQGVALLGANVLILEYPHQAGRAMQMMVQRFTTTQRPALAEMEGQLRELATCT